MGSSCQLEGKGSPLSLSTSWGDYIYWKIWSPSSLWDGINFLTLFLWCISKSHAILSETRGTIGDNFAVFYFGGGEERDEWLER